MDNALDDESLLRYARHILLDDIGIEGQHRIRQARVLIIGAGGLGCPAALYLAGAGVGHITIADADTVDLTNLQRQILHVPARIGHLKVDSARHSLNAFNSDVTVHTLSYRLEGTALDNAVKRADVVLDCSDNFATRHAVNRACVRHEKPLVSGAAIRFDGQLAVFNTADPASPCYHCLFPDGDDVDTARCATMGVFAPLTGVIGSLQAAEALKLLAGAGKPAVGSLLLYDARNTAFQRITVRRDPDCPVCARRKAHAPA